jgi:hypothetical protein
MVLGPLLRHIRPLARLQPRRRGLAPAPPRARLHPRHIPLSPPACSAPGKRRSAPRPLREPRHASPTPKHRSLRRKRTKSRPVSIRIHRRMRFSPESRQRPAYNRPRIEVRGPRTTQRFFKTKPKRVATIRQDVPIRPAGATSPSSAGRLISDRSTCPLPASSRFPALPDSSFNPHVPCPFSEQSRFRVTIDDAFL